ncbi:MAG: glycoside hydrolase family 27 protein, partial [Bacteroidota bacterium]
MKKLFAVAGILALAFLIACTHTKEQQNIPLGTGWKFKTGDDPAWASAAFPDATWDTICPSKIWEDQGYKGYDGFAWYRIHAVIPSSLRQNAFIKDSLQILLGKIDDCDQVFLNGELIGENGRTIYAKTEPSVEFFREQGRWYIERRYVLAAGDPRIHWDKENVLAIRSFDQGGAGGMFGKPFEISMTDLKDHLKFDFTLSAFDFNKDSMITKKIAILNLSGTEEFKGKLTIEAMLNDNGISIYSESTGMDITPKLKFEKQVTFKKNPASPATLRVTFTEATSGKAMSEEVEIPYILTPAVSLKPRINGAKVFGVRPWSPFQFKIAATGLAPLKYSATDLPEGLAVNPENGLITGSLKKKGDYLVKLKVENTLGFSERILKIVVGDLISLTPPLGWNSWNCWGLSVSDQKIRQSADAMKSSGLIDHGWTYINIDDGWEDTHDRDGNILTNSKFPNMKGLCNYVHSLGLKIGIYSSPGPKTCGGYEGSYTFEAKDAQNYASWGIDYLKYDWCSYWNIAPKATLEQMKNPYREMKHAIRKTNRDIHYSMCQYGMGDVWSWG